MLTTREIFDPSLAAEARTQRLIDWLEARRGRPVNQKVSRLLGYLVAHAAIAIPLGEIFQGESRLDLTIVNPVCPVPASPQVNVEAFARFLVEHSGLPEDKVTSLLATEGRYLALLGLTPWQASFATEEQYLKALDASDVHIEHGVDGTIVFDIDEFARLAGEAGGLTLDDIRRFSRYQTIYYYALGIEHDEDPDDPNPDPSLPPFTYRDVLPDVSFPWQFEAVISGEDRPTYEIAWHGDRLHHVELEDERIVAEADVQPTVAEWRGFWEELERLGVWEWERHYAAEGRAMEATCWSLDVEVGDRVFSSSGYDTFPEGFEGFCEALRKLAGERDFG